MSKMFSSNELITKTNSDLIIKINNLVSTIKTIIENDDSEKTQVEKEAEACFAFLGQNPNKLCPHGLQFFQCMPCSH